MSESKLAGACDQRAVFTLTKTYTRVVDSVHKTI